MYFKLIAQIEDMIYFLFNKAASLSINYITGSQW